MTYESLGFLSRYYLKVNGECLAKYRTLLVFYINTIQIAYLDALIEQNDALCLVPMSVSLICYRFNHVNLIDLDVY